MSGNFTKWSNTLKQFVGKLLTNCLSVFDHFVGLALKRLKLNYLIKCRLNYDKIHYLYHAANFSNMKNDLRVINWPQILDSCDKISCQERFLNTINPIILKYTPTQKPNSSKRGSIWMNKDTLSELNLKKISHTIVTSEQTQHKQRTEINQNEDVEKP